jgi:hypothetical protein
MNMIKIGSSIAAVALAGMTLAACTSAPAEKTAAQEDTKVETTEEVTTDDNGMWEAGLRVGVRHGFTSEGAEATDMACEGFAMMGVTDADGVVSLLEEMAVESGQSIEEALEIPADSLPEGVTVDEALAVAGDEIVQVCAL